MAGDFCTYMEQRIASDHFENKTFKLALHSADPTDAGTVAELVGSGYNTKDVTIGLRDSGTKRLYTTTDVLFDAATAPWPAVTHYTLIDTLNNRVVKGQFDVPKIANTGDQLRVAAGQVYFTID